MAVSIDAYSEHDQQIWDEELADFVPSRIFDSHIHLFHARHLTDPSEKPWSHADLSTLQNWAQRLYPEREVHFLCLGTPVNSIDADMHGQWCVDQIQRDPLSRLNRLVTPTCRIEDIERDVQQPGVIGLKPYRLFATTGDIAQCRIHEFLTHEQMEFASEHGLWITLHLSRFHGCADELNLKDLQEFTTHRYPNIKWILAHCARSFTYWPIRKAIDRLRDMPNIWYDLSAVTDVRPMITLFTRENPKRILYGSDGIDATCFHGQYAALGRAWQGVDAERQSLQFPHCDGRPILAIYEQLLSMKHASEIAQWSTDDIEDIFWRNAPDLFDVHYAQTVDVPLRTDGSFTQAMYDRARSRIPGGTQLLSKRPEMFAPGLWPAYARQARGCEVVDLDGRRFIDMTTSGIGSCLLGYADPDVTAAVQQRIARGSMSSLNASEEVELAELLIELHPWAEQVRFARSGGESMAIAVRIARAATGRDRVAFCGYHGWSDWYLAANLPPDVTGHDSASGYRGPNDFGRRDRLKSHLLPGLEPAGVPHGLAGTALAFNYNRLDELQQIISEHGADIAAVVMEPTRSVCPDPGFLQSVRSLCDQHCIALLFDEISSGWRMHPGGVHMKYGVMPDIAVFAKAISNGHPMAAVIGRRNIMEAAQSTFISSTYWTEAVGPTAAMATINKLLKVNIATHADHIGGLMRQVWQSLGNQHGLPVRTSGHNALLHLSFEHPQAAALTTLVTARMLRHGFLTGSGFYPSLAHTEQHIMKFSQSLDVVFAELSKVVSQGDVEQRLKESGSEVRHTGFARLT